MGNPLVIHTKSAAQEGYSTGLESILRVYHTTEETISGAIEINDTIGNNSEDGGALEQANELNNLAEELDTIIITDEEFFVEEDSTGEEPCAYEMYPDGNRTWVDACWINDGGDIETMALSVGRIDCDVYNNQIYIGAAENHYMHTALQPSDEVQHFLDEMNELSRQFDDSRPMAHSIQDMVEHSSAAHFEYYRDGRLFIFLNYYYEDIILCVEIDDLMFIVQEIELPDYVYHRIVTRPYALRLQSGKEYATSKYNRKRRNNNLLYDKMMEKEEQMRNKNLGSSKKNRKKNFYKKLNHLKKQGGFIESLSSFLPSQEVDSISETLENDSSNYKDIIVVVEKFILAYVAKSSSSTVMSVISLVLMMFQDSISVSIIERLKNMYKDMDIANMSIESFIAMIRSLSLDWDTLKQNKYAVSFMTTVTSFFSVVLCPALGRVIAPEILTAISDYLSSLKSSNIITCIVDTLVYVSNAVSTFMKTGSMKGFIYTETDHSDVMVRFYDVKAKHALYKTGDLASTLTIAVETRKYVLEVEELIKKIEALRGGSTGNALKDLNFYFKELNNIRTEIAAKEKSAGQRIAPFCFCLSSESGINKTHLTKLMAHKVARTNNIPCSPKHEYTKNLKDPFDSSRDNGTTIQYIDDVANEKSNPNGANNFGNVLLKARNPVTTTCLMPDVESKGKIFENCLVLAINTNSLYLGIPEENRYPSTQFRRLNVFITGKPKKEYRSNGGSTIDYTKVSKEDGEVIAPDLWEFTLFECEITPNTYGGKAREPKQSFYETSQEPNDSLYRFKKVASEISLQELLDYLHDSSIKHYQMEERALLVSKEVYEDDNWCSECRYPLQLCKCGEEVKKSLFAGLATEVDLCKHSGSFKKGEETSSHNLCDTKDIKCAESESPGLATEVDLCKQSGYENCDIALTDVLEKLKNLHELDQQESFLKLQVLACKGRLCFEEAYNTLYAYTGEFLACLIAHYAEKFSSYVYTMRNCSASMIPSYLEYTKLSRDIYMSHRMVRYGIKLDVFITRIARMLLWIYSFYKPNVNIMVKIQLISKLMAWLFLKFSITESVYSLNPVFIVKYMFFKTHRRFKELEDEFIDDFAEPFANLKDSDNSSIREQLLPSCIIAYTSYFIAPVFFKMLRPNYMEYQGGMDISIDRMSVFDKNVNSAWFSHRVPKILEPCPIEPKASYEELLNTVSRAVVYVRSNSARCCNGILIQSSYLILPLHVCLEMRKDGCTTCDIIRKPLDIQEGGVIPGNAIVRDIPITEYNTRRLEGRDLILVYSLRIGHVRDLLPYLSDRPLNQTPHGLIVYRNKQGVLDNIPAKDIERRHIPLLNELVDGYLYTSSNFDGLCGSPLIDTSRKHSFIMGIHNAGNEDGLVGASQLMLKQEIEETMQGLCGVAKQGGFTMKAYGNDLYDNTVHVNSILLSVPREMQSIQLIGSIHRRHNPVNKIVKTLICDNLQSKIQHSYNWKEPPLKGIDNLDKRYPYRRFIDIYTQKEDKVDMEILNEAKNDYLEPIMTTLRKNREFWYNELRVLTYDEIVQGIEDKKYINPMKMSSSCSKFLPGPKSAFATQGVDGKWTPDKIIEDEFLERDSKLRSGFRTYEPSFMMPKVEPTPMEKVEKGKVRVMFGYGFVSQMLLRKYSMTSVRMFCLLSSTTEVAVGINPHSKQWNKLYTTIRMLAGSNFIAFDFPNYDISVPPEYLHEAVEVFFTPILELGKLTHEDRIAIHMLKKEICMSVIDMNGDLVIMSGVLTSGNNLTSILGCIVNCLMMRSAFYIIYRGNPKVKMKGFKYVVILFTFGDDSIGKVRLGYRAFNVTSVIKALNSIGIKITNCQKNDVKIIYYTLNQLEFLKRTFKWLSEFGIYVAPLNIKSIIKQLSVMLPPTAENCNVATITASNIDGALFELKFHGKKVYESYRTILKECAHEAGISYMCRNLDMTYEDMVYAWKQQYDPELVTHDIDKRSIVDNLRLSWNDFIDASTTLVLDKTQNTNDNYNEDENHPVINMVDPDRSAALVKQSGVEQKPLVSFIGERHVDTQTMGVQPEDRLSQSNVGLKEFLARPVKIAEYGWGVGTVFSENIDPWEAFCSDKRVVNRINNYKLLKSKCHIKILINGNGFFYGRLMCSYHPLDNYDDFTAATAFIEADKTQLSQMPTVYIDPTTSQGGEMVLPFFTPYDYIDVTNLTEVGLGTLRLRELSPLKHANNTSAVIPQVTVTIYAWMSDVELLGPTHANAGYLVPQGGLELSLQSGREDESETKPISQAATNIANAASLARDIPVIGNYAQTIEKGARIASTLASSLGYCEPTVVNEPCKVIQRFNSNMATVNTADTSEKLAWDVKQGITSDPTTVGLDPVDQMSFAYILKRESYITKFTWARADVSDAFLFNVRVGPTMYALDAGSGAIVMASTCGCAWPFRYWSGTMIYKFVIVASSFHRGRMVIQYDPSYSQNTVLNAREDHVAFSRVIDISETREVEIEVSMTQDLGFLLLDKNVGNPQYSESSIYTGANNSYNGTLSVYVQNELTSPNPDATINSDIEVLVFCKGGDDLQFASASANLGAFQLKPQGGIEEGNADAIDTRAFDNATSDVIGDSLPNNFNKIYGGESITSLRTLAKRFGYYRFEGNSDSAVNSTFAVRHPMYPVWRGPMTLPIDGTYNYVNTTLMAYVMAAFSGVRGSCRYKILVNSNKDSNIVQVTWRAGPGYGKTTTAVNPTTRNQVEFQTTQVLTTGGMNAFDVDNNKVVEFEIPWYSEYKFLAGKQQNLNASILNGFYFVTKSTGPAVAESRETHLLMHVAAGEDFDCLFYTGWPRLYRVTSFPP